MKKKNKQMLGNMELSAFCDQLSMIVSAGLSLYEGISILQEDASDEETGKILAGISDSLSQGQSFHQALEASGAFPKYVLDMTEIGESSGKLEDVFKSLSQYYKREESIQGSIRNAVTYPITMIIMMLAGIVVLIVKVLPVFHQIYASLGSDLTGFAGRLMSISNSLNRYMFVFIIVLAVLALAIVIVYHSAYGVRIRKKSKYAMGVAASRFANCMALALSSGLDSDQGMEFAGQLVDNPYMAARIEKCRELTASGKGFAEAVLEADIFDKIYVSMLTISFRTGLLDETMQKISEKYEEAVDKQISRFISVLEPTLVIILSVIVGLILISFLLPLIGIMSSIG